MLGGDSSALNRSDSGTVTVGACHSESRLISDSISYPSNISTRNVVSSSAFGWTNLC